MIRMRCLLGALLVAFAVLCVAFDSALAEARVALVIGNGSYRNVPRLPNPVNDANDVAAALSGMAFKRSWPPI